MLTLLPHQLEGVRFLVSRPGALLAYEQGLGKTAITIRAFEELKIKGEISKLLVICPNSLKDNWADEIDKFGAELSCTVINASGKRRRELLGKAATDIFIINYEAARSEITALRALLSRHAFALVLDESHNVKNLQSINSLVAQNLSPYAKFKWLLSGTPVTNKPADIYSQINLIVTPNPLGSLALFEINFGAGGADQQTRLSHILEPYVIRKTKVECLKLPEKIFRDIWITLPEWQRELYKKFQDKLVEDILSIGADAFAKFIPSALGRLTRLSQIASNPSLVDVNEKRTPAKWLRLDEIIHSSAIGSEKIIIWSNYVQTIEALLERYRNAGAVAIYGKIIGPERQEIARRFQTDPSLRILVANPAAAGTGFTFTSARYSVFESLNWRYDHFAQSQDRNHRIGQSRDVVYLRLLARDTLDEAIVLSLQKKEEMAKGILGDFPLASSFSKMNQDECIDLILKNKLPEYAVKVS